MNALGYFHGKFLGLYWEYILGIHWDILGCWVILGYLMGIYWDMNHLGQPTG